jgi:hypothetical protein
LVRSSCAGFTDELILPVPRYPDELASKSRWRPFSLTAFGFGVEAVSLKALVEEHAFATVIMRFLIIYR